MASFSSLPREHHAIMDEASELQDYLAASQILLINRKAELLENVGRVMTLPPLHVHELPLSDPKSDSILVHAASVKTAGSSGKDFSANKECCADANSEKESVQKLRLRAEELEDKITLFTQTLERLESKLTETELSLAEAEGKKNPYGGRAPSSLSMTPAQESGIEQLDALAKELEERVDSCKGVLSKATEELSTVEDERRQRREADFFSKMQAKWETRKAKRIAADVKIMRLEKEARKKLIRDKAIGERFAREKRKDIAWENAILLARGDEVEDNDAPVKCNSSLSISETMSKLALVRGALEEEKAASIVSEMMQDVPALLSKPSASLRKTPASAPPLLSPMQVPHHERATPKKDAPPEANAVPKEAEPNAVLKVASISPFNVCFCQNGEVVIENGPPAPTDDGGPLGHLFGEARAEARERNRIALQEAVGRQVSWPPLILPHQRRNDLLPVGRDEDQMIASVHTPSRPSALSDEGPLSHFFHQGSAGALSRRQEVAKNRAALEAALAGQGVCLSDVVRSSERRRKAELMSQLEKAKRKHEIAKQRASARHHRSVLAKMQANTASATTHPIQSLSTEVFHTVVSAQFEQMYGKELEKAEAMAAAGKEAPRDALFKYFYEMKSLERRIRK